MRNAGIEFEDKAVTLDFPSDNSHLLEFSPSKRVPMLIDGELRVWDSMAILEYIAEKYPGAGLWPQDQSARAHARAISMEMHAGFAALRGALHMNMRREPAPTDTTLRHSGESRNPNRVFRPVGCPCGIRAFAGIMPGAGFASRPGRLHLMPK